LINDVSFEECIFQYASFGKSQLSGVAFRNWKKPISAGHGWRISSLRAQACCRSTFNAPFCEREDLRGTELISVVEGGGLVGLLIADGQAQELAYTLALGAGASIERS
jgi:hypothetical protein